MTIRNTLASLSAAALVFAPVAASAGTSAAASVPSLGSSIASGARASSAVAKKSELKAGLALAVILAGGAAAYGLAKALDNKKSRGAN